MADILGIKLSDQTPADLLKNLDFFLMENQTRFITTPNPEIILRSQEDEEYFFILNSADLSIADGFGLVLAGIVSGQKIHRLPGSDLTVILLDKAEKQKLKVLIINRSDGLSQKEDIEESLKEKWPQLNFLILDTEKKESLSLEENKIINDFAPHIVFVGLGAPLQEKLIWHEKENWPGVRIAMGIGGSFDFITGKIKRAPKIFRISGLEWLWRLWIQPQNKKERLKRIWTATVIFGLKVIDNYFIKSFFYRPNVACFLYKKDGERFQIFTVKRTDDKNHWQLPQGGTDGESLEIAGSRELREETGTDKFIVKKTFNNIHRYKFADLKRTAYRGYKGQKQGLIIAEFIGSDEDIKISYWDHSSWQWVPEEKLIETLHECRQEAAKKFLKKFAEVVK